MKHLLMLFITFKTCLVFGQNTNLKDTIGLPIYDTTSIDIKSTNSFYFCSKLYAIPRNCDGKNQSNCCSFSAQITKWNKGPLDGQISCYNGTSLSWSTFDSEEVAKKNFESLPDQMKKQMKNTTKKRFRFLFAIKKLKPTGKVIQHCKGMIL